MNVITLTGSLRIPVHKGVYDTERLNQEPVEENYNVQSEYFLVNV